MSKGVDTDPNRRMSGDERRASILEAAREAFSDTGDMSGTTVRLIADRAGISEGVIYRHFDSKDQLFYEAVVEPLREAIDVVLTDADDVERLETMSPDEQREELAALLVRLTRSFDTMLPLLGLVLFGDPSTATRFYRDDFAVAVDRLVDAWVKVGERYGVDVELAATSVRTVMGAALILALEGRHGQQRRPTEDVCDEIAIGMTQGFFARRGHHR